MTIHRFFIDQNIEETKEIILPEEVSHQITQVLRLKPGEQIIILDNTGWEFACILLRIDKKHTAAKIIKKQLNQNDPEIKVHLYQSLINRDNFELILQKAVELGVSIITPIYTERSQFGISWAEERMDRFTRIIKEAAEQSERGKLPEINSPLNFEAAIIEAEKNGTTWIAWEKEANAKSFPKVGSDSINIFIGPEGGFTEPEIEFAENHNVKPLSLGKTILRAETAAIALLAKILI